MIKDLDKSLGRIKYDKRLCDVQWAIPEKSPGIFRFVILPLETPGKVKLHPWKFCKIRGYTPWKFQGQKPRPIKIPHDFFLITPGNFLIDHRNAPANSIFMEYVNSYHNASIIFESGSFLRLMKVCICWINPLNALQIS